MSTGTKKDSMNQAKETAGQAVEKGREAAGQAGEAISQAASAVGQNISSAASAVGHKAEDATAAVGQGVQRAAQTVREHGPGEGMLGSATQSVADTLESTGKYLEDKNLSGMVNDVAGLVKRNPIPAVLIGLGIGFLIGRTLSSSSSSRS